MFLYGTSLWVKSTVFDYRLLHRSINQSVNISIPPEVDVAYVSSTASPALRFRNAIKRAFRASDASANDMDDRNKAGTVRDAVDVSESCWCMCGGAQWRWVHC